MISRRGPTIEWEHKQKNEILQLPIIESVTRERMVNSEWLLFSLSLLYFPPYIYFFSFLSTECIEVDIVLFLRFRYTYKFDRADNNWFKCNNELWKGNLILNRILFKWLNVFGLNKKKLGSISIIRRIFSDFIRHLFDGEDLLRRECLEGNVESHIVEICLIVLCMVVERERERENDKEKQKWKSVWKKIGNDFAFWWCFVILNGKQSLRSNLKGLTSTECVWLVEICFCRSNSSSSRNLYLSSRDQTRLFYIDKIKKTNKYVYSNLLMGKTIWAKKNYMIFFNLRVQSLKSTVFYPFHVTISSYKNQMQKSNLIEIE